MSLAKNFATVFVGAALVLALSFAVATPVSAASITNIRFDNNQTQASCTPGQMVTVHFRINVPVNEVVELGEVDVISDQLSPDLPTSLGGELGLQEGPHDVQATVRCPQNTGTYSVQYRTAGVYGGQRASTMSDGVVSTNSFGGALDVVSDGNDTVSSGGASNGMPSWFNAWLNSYRQDRCEDKGGTWNSNTNQCVTSSTASPVCAQLTSLVAFSSKGQYSTGNTNLQKFLIGNGGYIPFIAADPSDESRYGFYGAQTENALVGVKSVKGCTN